MVPVALCMPKRFSEKKAAGNKPNAKGGIGSYRRPLSVLDDNNPSDQVFDLVSVFSYQFFSLNKISLTIFTIFAIFHQVVNHNFRVVDAIKYTKRETSSSALYARKAWYKAGVATTRLDEAAAASLLSLSVASAPGPAVCVGKKATGKRKSPIALSIDNKLVGINALVETLPGWVDKVTVKQHMTREKRLTAAEMNLAHFAKQADDNHRSAKYSRAFKAATSEYADGCDGISEKKGRSLRSIATHFNKEMLWSPSDRKLTKTAIRNAYVRGQCGVSPPKRGAPVKITR